MAEGWRLKLLRVAVSQTFLSVAAVAICIALAVATRHLGIWWIVGAAAVFISFFLGWAAAYRFWRKNGYVKNI